MKKILITGGSGYIGSYLRDYLSGLGYEVLSTSRKPGGSSCRQMDLLDDSSIQGVCKDIDIVIHTASMDERLIPNDGKGALLANAYATRQLYLDAVKHEAELFVYFSTFHVYGAEDGIITEQSKAHPSADYGLTHLFAEMYLEQMSAKYQTKVKVVRLSNGIGYPPEGCDKWYLIVNDCCRNAVENHKIVLRTHGYQKRNFVAIADVCDAVQLLLEAPSAKHFDIYNIGSQANISMREIARLTAEKYKQLSGKEAELIIPETDDAVVTEFEFSTEKIRKLGWREKHGLEEVIKDILQKLLNGNMEKRAV